MKPIYLDAAGHEKVSNAVRAAEADTSGEIVTVLADRSDGYTDIAMAWAGAAAFMALASLALFPDLFLSAFDVLMGGWVQEWDPQRLFWFAALSAALVFVLVMLVQLWPPVKFAIIPGRVRTARVHDRAVSHFKVGAERRTHGHTGILLYLSMREHRAEIVADKAIDDKVSDEVWGDAMIAMIAELKQDRIAEAMAVGVQQVGVVLAEHFPRHEDDENELPDRLIEI